MTFEKPRLPMATQSISIRKAADRQEGLMLAYSFTKATIGSCDMPGLVAGGIKWM